ncbi:DUF5325 family protein [Neobacillus sp. YIM B06451]|uniref:DUF5325 family protein n=1 Tax=Neobacillus sp. YIM B06451 TaxID=3070994 RepID=UPI002931097D|nr:DUF5325 family protein [Neobacillus sp. YIM B06451]
MKEFNWVILVFAILTAAGISGIGIAIGEQSIYGVLLSIAILVFAIRGGFKQKRKAAKKH